MTMNILIFHRDGFQTKVTYTDVKAWAVSPYIVTGDLPDFYYLRNCVTMTIRDMCLWRFDEIMLYNRQ